MWNLNQFISGGDEEQQDNLLGDTEGLCSLSPLQQRIYGFAACLLAGLVLMFLSLIVFAKPIKFALLFTFGNMLAVGRANLVLMDFLVNPSWKSDNSKFVSTAEYLTFLNCSSEFKLETVSGSTAFLIGPEQQMRMMLDPVRIFATAIYIGCVVLALICALWIHSKILTLIAIICEICALIWYSLSYIPFARRVVSDMTIRLFDTEI
ncbi:hypothetical protein C3L33_03343, partial [Rhododendron williamsianum]